MQTSPTTPEVAFWLEFDLAKGQKLIDWAIGLMLEGSESSTVAQLAGTVEPYSHFELVERANAILAELNLGNLDRQTIIDIFLRQTLKDTLSGKRNYLQGLHNLYQLCLELDYDENFMDFYLLYNAKSDLEYSAQQWYWEGANRDNIDEICFEYMLDWLKEHPE